MRTFLIYYPESNLFDTQQVEVRDGEDPVDAITRDGHPLEEWKLEGEVIPAR